MERTAALVVMPYGDLRTRLVRELSRRLTRFGLIVETAGRAAEAMERLTQMPFDLLVTHVGIPAEEQAPLLPGQYNGIQLFDHLARLGRPPRGILIAPVPDARIQKDLETLRGVHLVCEGLAFCQDVVNAASDLLGPVAAGHANRRRLKIVITLNPTRGRSTWELIGEGDLVLRANGNLVIPALKELAYDSRQINELRQWREEALRHVGLEIMEKVIRSNVELYAQFMHAVGRLDDEIEQAFENVTICFRNSADIHRIALEAIVSEHTAEKYWMLKMPIYRCLEDFPSTRLPLFAKQSTPEEKEINCLIIEADAAGEVPEIRDPHGDAIVLPQLSSVHRECQELNRYLSDNRAAFNVGRVSVLDRAAVHKGEMFDEALERVLTGSTWDIVHFCGHSLVDDTTKKGYVFLPSPVDGNAVESLDVQTFAAQLRRTRFLYLSSCYSSEEVFSEAVAASNVPAAVGFRWPVNDQHASEYASEFYRQLFDDEAHCIEGAFLKARRKMYDRHAADSIWAAPMLVLQS